MEMGDKILINLEDIGDVTATSIRQDVGYTYYIFDNIIGYSSMDNIDESIAAITNKFPKNIQDRLIEIRLPEIFEVFPGNVPSYLTMFFKELIQVNNSQFSYFDVKEHRQATDYKSKELAIWWLGYKYNDHLFALVNTYGAIFLDNRRVIHGVRPLFILKDTPHKLWKG